MKATEFRLGNLYKYFIVDEMDPREAWWELCQMDVDSLRWLVNNPEDKDYRPIPLTEEWLLKFGFIEQQGRHGAYFFHHEKELFRVWENSYESNCWGVGRIDPDSANRKYNTHWIVLNLKHVHQLQNLYHALTGEELQLTN